MTYNNFAYHYDKMTADVNYSWWLNHITKNVPTGSRILDVACGTGTLTLALKNLGYDIFGLDLSADMLVVAKEKADHFGADINFIQRDMKELDGLQGFDCALIALDSLNYLTNATDVQHTIAEIYQLLNPEGIFIFDVHTPHKMLNTLKDYLFVENDDNLTYIWHVEAGEQPLSVVHELTMFTKNNDGSYSKFLETHQQRTFEMAQYENWLADAGFEVKTRDGDQDRQLFIARKVGKKNA